MNVLADYHIIKDTAGNPAFVVILYSRWVKQSSIIAGLTPNEVVGAVIEGNITPFRAWREYLGLTQTEVAIRTDIIQAFFRRSNPASTRPGR